MTQKSLFIFFSIIFIGGLGVRSVGATSLYGQLSHSTCIEPMDGYDFHQYLNKGMTGHVDTYCWFGNMDWYTQVHFYRQTTNYANNGHGGTNFETLYYTDFAPADAAYYQNGSGDSVAGYHNLEQWHCADTDFTLDPNYYYLIETYPNVSICGSTSSSAYESTSYDLWQFGGATRYSQWSVKDLAWSFGNPAVTAEINVLFPADTAITTDFSTWQLEFNVAEAGSGTIDVKYGLSGYFTYTDTISYYALDTELAAVNIPKSRLLSPDTYNVYAILRDSEGNAVDTSELNYFEVQSGAYFNNNYYEPPPTGTSTPVVTCDPASGFFNESICKMMTYLFTPDPDKYNDLVGLKDELNEKAPFAYFNLAKALFEDVEIETGEFPEASIEMNLFGSSPTIVPLVAFESDFVSKDDFSQVRSAFSYVLWLMFLSYLFVRPLELLTNKK